MFTDYQRDWLSKEMGPLTKLSKDGGVYIVRAQYIVERAKGFSEKCEQTSYFVRRSKALGEIEQILNEIDHGRILYLALDVYYHSGARSSDDSIEIIDRRDSQ